MPRFKMINGNRVQFTPEEETQRDADEAQAIINEQAEKVARDAKVADNASAKQKLKNLGLTDEEISAFRGGN